MTKQDEIERWEKKVAWWAEQAARIERDRHGLKWILIVGAPLAVGAGLWKSFLGLAVAGVALVTWMSGVYMTTVRRGEFAYNLTQAQDELTRVRQE